MVENIPLCSTTGTDYFFLVLFSPMLSKHKHTADAPYFFKEKTTAQQYEAELEKKLETKQVNWKREKGEGKWNIIKNVLQETADEVLEVKDREKRQGWFDEECREIIKKRNEARRKMIERRTRTNVEQFRQKKKEADKLCR
ncbi:hypothetical protein J437_LFUL015096 [Ladona fulva]|uniref:Uncharacterized protein n=1 Tax=Ladona fulva TaxID=123851 RepID=A0A8K0KK40_LADFU|nr:hypothetical protein J437_LFUL015096 [Ladona fulva]